MTDTALYNWFWAQQDYFWFVAGIGWLVVGVRWWHGRGGTNLPGWVPWSAATGLAIAVISIGDMMTPVVRLVPYQKPGINADMALGSALAVQSAGWWMAALWHTVRGRMVAICVALVVAAAAGLRYAHPTEGMVIILSAQLGGLGWWISRRCGGSFRWRLGLVTTVLAAVLDSTGPVAELTTWIMRWYDVSPLGPVTGLAHMLATGMILLAWSKDHAAHVSNAHNKRTDRWIKRGMCAWLALGFFIAIAAGSWARRSFEQNALGRVRASAALLSQEKFETLLDHRLQIDRTETHYIPDGTDMPVGFSSHAAQFAPAATEELNRLAAVNHDLRWLTLSTIRDGHLVCVALATPKPGNSGLMMLLRASTGEDERDWAEKRSAVIGPASLSFGNFVIARAPLSNRTGQMIGWLDFSFAVSQWIAAQAQPRALAYVIVALGLVVGQQWLVQLTRAHERDRAQASATALAQANDLKTTFLAKVSHELRTPLQSFLGYTELMLPEANARDRARLVAMREHAGLMSRLVNDLIDLSAAECGKFQLVERPVALTDLVTQAAESLRPSAESKRLSYAIAVEPSIPAGLYADPQRVRQVVLNLVGNAIKYTDHGHISVTLACPACDAQHAEIELRVADTGPGIAPEVQAHLFATFARLEPTVGREGTGLGLAIVAAVSKAMGGDARVSSDGRTGSTFTARWRLQVAAAPAPAPAGRVPLHGKRVLVADDNTLVRDLFIAYLSECGAVCAPAKDGVEALDLLQTGTFDTVVLDLAMPRLDGLATVRQLRRAATGQGWRVVGVSAHAGGAEHQDALTAGMDAFLTKPVALPDLARALAPSAGWIPPDPAFAPMRGHFEHRFQADARTQSATIAAALATDRWSELERAAHHLRNSAGVVSDTELMRACAVLETAARSHDRVTASAAWHQCGLALERWLASPAQG